MENEQCFKDKAKLKVKRVFIFISYLAFAVFYTTLVFLMEFTVFKDTPQAFFLLFIAGYVFFAITSYFYDIFTSGRINTTLLYGIMYKIVDVYPLPLCKVGIKMLSGVYGKTKNNVWIFILLAIPMLAHLLLIPVLFLCDIIFILIGYIIVISLSLSLNPIFTFLILSKGIFTKEYKKKKEF